MLSQLFAASEYPSLVRILSMKCLSAFMAGLISLESNISFMTELLIVGLLAYHLMMCVCVLLLSTYII